MLLPYQFSCHRATCLFSIATKCVQHRFLCDHKSALGTAPSTKRSQPMSFRCDLKICFQSASKSYSSELPKIEYQRAKRPSLAIQGLFKKTRINLLGWESPAYELLPAISPIVWREAVETSTRHQRPCGFNTWFKASGTISGRTMQR